MSIDHSSPNAVEVQDTQGDGLSCVYCRTDLHLIVESIQTPDSKKPGFVSIEYSCGHCEAFFAHDASVESVAKLLANSHCETGVLQFGSYYIHCGEPMTPGRIKLARLKVSDGDLADAPGLAVPSMVLRCRCGFQISLPV
ncbi:hypothetical protein CVS30_08690 [Arthrobacter psychrolactophilus]|uniref:Uncharacterized protein n=1 Tax=Arthrobacter psychrolactophilus TaxID=92442 RepID=A0A2V5IWL1_9MICC|nr:hypothetical protein [Arthrobacter psychrolactophilus]PYI38633.1 hypothetical protein CVS30_08690 [Arthrobacter psychrolactophilus]